MFAGMPSCSGVRSNMAPMSEIKHAECVRQLLISLGAPLHNAIKYGNSRSYHSIYCSFVGQIYLWQSGTPRFPRCSHGAGTVAGTSSIGSTLFWIDTQTKALGISQYII